MAIPWVVVGAGYTGMRLAKVLVGGGHPVTVTRRDRTQAEAAAAELGARAAGVELERPDSLAGLVPEGAIVACLAPPGAAPAAGIQALLAATASARRLVYVSSTGVYGHGHGAWVDEAAPIAPISASGAARVAAERAVSSASISSIVLRPAGIYGPGRGIAERLRAGTYRVVGDGRAHVSRIHVDDLVQAIIRAGESALTGAINVADDDPAPIGEVADAIAHALGLPPPPRVAADSVAPEIAAMLTADRRIVNRRMKDELGVVLRYPSWRDGLVA